MVVIFTPVTSLQLKHIMKKIRYYIKVEKLDDFTECINNYKILITYNGKSFDIPFIENLRSPLREGYQYFIATLLHILNNIFL